MQAFSHLGVAFLHKNFQDIFYQWKDKFQFSIISPAMATETVGNTLIKETFINENSPIPPMPAALVCFFLFYSYFFIHSYIYYRGASCLRFCII